MGHTYFEGIQLSDRVAITYSIGIGAYGGAVFLNAVRVYCFDGSNKKLVGEKIYGGMNYCFYSDYAAKSAAKDILLDYLKSQTRILGANVPEKDLEDYACCQIEAARNTGKMLME